VESDTDPQKVSAVPGSMLGFALPAEWQPVAAVKTIVSAGLVTVLPGSHAPGIGGMGGGAGGDGIVTTNKPPPRMIGLPMTWSRRREFFM
jgi:hypothetical protein